MRLDTPALATVPLAALLAAGPTTAPADAQDLMLAGGLGSSAFTELGAPVSVALHGRIPLTAWEGLRLGRHLELRGAILAAQTLLAAGSEGVETGRSSGNYYPQSRHRGLAVMGEVAWRGLTEMGTPFCGEGWLRTYELGLAFVPGLAR